MTTQKIDSMADAASQQYPWYSVVSGGGLEQGDVLMDCPVLLVPPDVLRQEGERNVIIERQNVIVLTQSCDLAIRKDGTCGVDDVILAAIHFRHELNADPRFKKKEEWENARKGKFPSYHVLNKCDIAGHKLDFMLVDLRKVFSLSVDAVREIASDRARNVYVYCRHTASTCLRHSPDSSCGSDCL